MACSPLPISSSHLTGSSILASLYLKRTPTFLYLGSVPIWFTASCTLCWLLGLFIDCVPQETKFYKIRHFGVPLSTPLLALCLTDRRLSANNAYWMTSWMKLLTPLSFNLIQVEKHMHHINSRGGGEVGLYIYWIRVTYLSVEKTLRIK